MAVHNAIQISVARTVLRFFLGFLLCTEDLAVESLLIQHGNQLATRPFICASLIPEIEDVALR
jgi:hypothetical protein